MPNSVRLNQIRVNPVRPAIMATAKSARAQRIITHSRLTAPVVRRFVAGPGRADALRVAGELLAGRRAVSIDYLGEDTHSAADAAATVAEYCGLIADLAVLCAAEDPARVEVSVKLTALGLAVDHDLAYRNARAIAAAADASGVWVTVDAEQYEWTDSTHAIVRRLREEFPMVGLVVQAYLHRSVADCREFANARVRLCKGAYREPAGVAHQDRAKIRDAYLACLGVLLGGNGYPMIATHDPVLSARARELIGEHASEWQMLYGIRRDEQQRLVESGEHLRIYVPYGGQWYGYLMRRLAEKPANLQLFLRALAERGPGR